MFKINDLIHIHKPSGNIYKIYDIKTYWIPNGGGDGLTEEPADLSNYWVSIILHYHWYSNATGKIINVNDPTYCGIRFAHPFDKQKLLNTHQQKIDKIKNKGNLSEPDVKAIAKLELYIQQVTQNLW